MHQMLVIGNPSRRRKRKAKKSRASRASRRRRTSGRKRSRVRVVARRNPLSPRGLVSGIVPTVKDGAIGAVGGLANDVLYGYAASKISLLPQSGIAKHAAKILSAVAVGAVGNMVMRGRGGALARGAATVAIHAALKEQMLTMPFFAALPLGEYMSGDETYASNALPVSGIDDDMGDMLETGAVGEYMADYET